MMRDTENPEQQAKLEREVEVDRARELYDLRQLCERRDFRDFMFRLLGAAHQGATNPYFKNGPAQRFEGERNIGNFVLTELLTANPLIYTVMQREAYTKAELLKDNEGED